MRKLRLLSYFLFLTQILSAQNVQWAATVVEFSSQRGEQAYSANQILGAPNAMEASSNPEKAWSPKNENAFLGESIHVEFVKPIAIQQVVIAESQNPGAIETIILYDTKNRRHLVYENELPQPIYKKNRLFQHIFPKTNYEVKGVAIQLQTSAVEGSNQIDAVGISASKEKPQLKKQPTEELTSRGVSVPNAENLGPQINSQYAERLPIISPDGQTLYFARKYHPQNFGAENHDDIWYANRLPDGTWSKALNIGAPLNNKEHNFVVACSPAGDVLYLANDYRTSKKDGVSISVRKGRTWSQPKSLDIEDHYNDNPYVGYYMGVDGRTLLMSIERKEGYGKRDLYVSFKQSGNKWSKPMNLGSGINTPDEETSVFLAADGKTIYFASNGRPKNIGGLDIYMSKRLDDTWRRWSTPKNLGKDFNTADHDFNFTIPASGDYAYFSSGPIKSSNLYRIKLPQELRPEPVTLVTGRMIDKESNQPIDGKLTYQSLDKNVSASSMETNAAGEFKMVVPYGENVGIYAEQAGYFAVSENLKLSADGVEELDYMPDENVAPNDAELDNLQEQYNRLNAEVQQLEVSRSQPKTSVANFSNTGEATAFKDPELEALRAQYKAAVLKNNPSNTVEPSAANSEDNSNSKPVEAEEELSELDKMKAKFNRAHNLSEAETEPEVIDSRAILENKKSDDPELAKMKAKFNKAHGIEDPFAEEEIVENEASDEAFNQLEQEVRTELALDLLEDVKLDLQREVLEDAKKEVATELDDTEKNKLNDPTLEKEVKAQYVELVKAELRAEYKEAIQAELREEWEEKIKDELRKTMRDEVKAELRRELREEVKAELREELKYQIKKELEAEIKQEIEAKKQEEVATKPQNTTHPVEEEIEEPFAPVYQEVKQDIVLVPIKVGQVIPMNNIFFDSNESNLKEASFSELERVLAFLQKNPNLIVEVGGHTNGWCSHSFANELSDKRAKEVADYFIENGIAAQKIQHRGYGKVEPIASNDNATGRRKNQRVELKILEILD